MRYNEVHINRVEDEYRVEAYNSRMDEPVWDHYFETVAVDGIELDVSTEATFEGHGIELELNGMLASTDGTALNIKINSGCDHPVIALERM